MTGYLQAWRPAIFVSGLVFSGAIVDNGVIGNLMSILGATLGRNMAQNAVILAVQMSLTSLMAIAGSFLTDAYFGKYCMINISSIIYIIALVILSCLIWKGAEAYVYLTCFLIATGHGCFESLLEVYGEDQINFYYEGKRRAKVLHQIWWWTPKFLGSAVGSIILLIVEESGWKYAGWLTTGVMLVAFIFFLCGRSFYKFNNDKPPISALRRVIHVFVAATLNRHLPLPDDLYENREEEHDHTLPRTNTLRCLDKAAIPPSAEDAEKTKWRLCRVTEVEETKRLLGTFPIWATLVTCGIVSTVQQTLFIQQAYYMERRLGYALVPVTSLFVLAGLSKVVIDRFHFLLVDRITILGHRITPKIQIGLGIFSSMLCCITAALVERRRLNAYSRNDVFPLEIEEYTYNVVNVSIFWLIPQFFLIGAMDGLVCSGIQDFFNEDLPDGMKNFHFSFLASVYAAGFSLFALLATIMNKATNWLGEDINSSHVDYVYWGLGILSSVNFCIYAFISWRHKRIGEGEEIDHNIGNDNDNGEATTSAAGRTSIEMGTVEEQESGTRIASSEHV